MKRRYLQIVISLNAKLYKRYIRIIHKRHIQKHLAIMLSHAG